MRFQQTYISNKIAWRTYNLNFIFVYDGEKYLSLDSRRIIAYASINRCNTMISLLPGLFKVGNRISSL